MDTRQTIIDEIDDFRDILTAYLFNIRDLSQNELEKLSSMTHKSVYELSMIRLINNGFTERE